MNKIKKILCIIFATLLFLAVGISASAITGEASDSPIKIEVATDKAKYNVTGIAEITATITNTGDSEIKNLSAEAVFADLAPVKGGSTTAETATLKSGESIRFSYKATLNKSAHKLNIFQKIILWFVRLFNGGYTAKDNSFDNGRENIEKADTLSFGKFKAKNTVRVWYENTNSENNNIVTRGEWILKLAETLDWSEQIEMMTETNCRFADISGGECEKAVQYACLLNLFDEVTGNFYPNEPATREFAAVTSVRALQFNEADGLNCNDLDLIKHKKEVYPAIATGIFSLENNYFYPDRELTVAESKKAVLSILDIVNSAKVDSEHKNEIIYTDNVIKLSNQIEYTQIDENNFEFVISQKTKEFKTGDIFLPENEIPYKIKNINNENGKYIVETEEPRPEEAFKSIDVQEVKEFKKSDIILGEGCTWAEPEEGEYRKSPKLNKRDFFDDISLNIEVPLKNDIKLYAKATVKNPRVEYIAELDWLNPICITPLYIPDVKNCMLKFSFDSEIEGGIKDGGKGLDHEGAVTIASFPVVGAGNIGVYVELQVAYTIDGRISVIYNISGSTGVHIYKNMFRRTVETIDSTHSNFKFVELEAEARTGIKIAGLLEIGKDLKLIDFSLFGGAAAKGTLQIRNSKLSCLSANTYMFLTFEAMKDSEIGEWLKLEYSHDIFDENTSPIKQSLHFENLKIVPECTYKPEIPDDAVEFNGNYYAVCVDSKIGWHDSQKACESVGGHLATISSEEENQFVYNIANKYNIPCWLGATDEQEEGVWKWVTNEEWNYCNSSFDNKNGKQHYLVINYILDKWDDQSEKNEPESGLCDTGGYVCEWEAK